jgi:hypothetical protein
MTDHVVQYSGGVSSWAVAKIVKDDIMQDGDTLHLLFADTTIEDEDTYRFLYASAENVGVPVTRIADGRDIWQVFKDVGFLGNSRLDPCSRVLKRDLLRKHIENNFDPETAIIYLGIDWTEVHRLDRARPRWEPWQLDAPLVNSSMSKDDLLAWADREGLPRQRLYEWGMPHANCGGGCVKAGISHFVKLHDVFPERFAEWEANEQSVRDHLGKDVSMLKDRRGGTAKPLTLRDLRLRIETERASGEQLSFPTDEWGGCGCAID